MHRIGRTGRAGRLGKAYTLVTLDDKKSIGAVEAMIKNKIDYLGPTLDELPPGEPSEKRSRTPREKSARTRSDRPGRKPVPHGEVASMTPLVFKESDAVAGVDVATAQPVERAPRPAREAAPKERTPRERAPRDRAPRESSAREAAPRDSAPRERAPREAAPRDEQRTPRPAPERRYRDQDDREPTPKGLGDHVPGFMMRSVVKPKPAGD